MREALNGNAWILKIKPDTIISIDHIREFFTLWMLVHVFHLNEQIEDDIVWKHSNDGVYLASIAYKTQFLGMTHSSMDLIVWAPPKDNFFGWLALQDQTWNAY